MQYLKIRFTNIETLRVADDSTSQSGQISSMKYIPGSTIRGIIINKLAKRSDFEDIKTKLFSEKVRFLNAYMVDNDKKLIPSLKGFYENKSGDGILYNVLVSDDVSEGKKRASLGNYCLIDNNILKFYSVDMGSEMRNKIMLLEGEKQNVYRYEYMMPGYEFITYIAIEDESLYEIISDSIGNEMIIGNARSTGLGKCVITDKTLVSETPYKEYALDENISSPAYLTLLSDTTMRNKYGEYCGLDLEKLENILGITNLQIEACSTSIVCINGYNRKIKSKLQPVNMYEKGSVFKLIFDGEISVDKVNVIQDKGIGVRKNEGFGRVLFIKGYEDISKKIEGKCTRKIIEDGENYKEDNDVLKLVARNYYINTIEKAIINTVVGNPLRKGTLSSSQVGALESRIIANKYDYKEAVRAVCDYYNHAQEKEDKAKVQKDRSSIRQLKDFVLGVFDTDIDEVLGITKLENVFGISKENLLTEEEKGRYKLQYILEAIHFDNRKGAK